MASRLPVGQGWVPSLSLKHSLSRGLIRAAGVLLEDDAVLLNRVY